MNIDMKDLLAMAKTWVVILQILIINLNFELFPKIGKTCTKSCKKIQKKGNPDD